jgi:hypothetical protein
MTKRKAYSHTAGYKIANRVSLKKYLKSIDLYFTCYESEKPKVDEKKELDLYIQNFGETPPLNQ